MNRTLIDAAEKAAQAEALIKATEMIFAKIELGSQSITQSDRVENLLYIAEDLIGSLQDDIEKLQYDEKIVDVFSAAHQLRIENGAK